MSSAPTDCRVPITPDPTDAKADGGFGNHRAGYSPDKLANAEYWARKGGTLNAGEGAILCAEIDRLRLMVEALQFPVSVALESIAERKKVERILAKLREPTAAMFDAADLVKPHVGLILRAALDAATWEVSHDAG